MKTQRSIDNEYINADINQIPRDKATTTFNNYNKINLNMTRRGQSIIEKPANMKVTAELEKML